MRKMKKTHIRPINSYVGYTFCGAHYGKKPLRSKRIDFLIEYLNNGIIDTTELCKRDVKIAIQRCAQGEEFHRAYEAAQQRQNERGD